MSGKIGVSKNEARLCNVRRRNMKRVGVFKMALLGMSAEIGKGKRGEKTKRRKIFRKGEMDKEGGKGNRKE